MLTENNFAAALIKMGFTENNGVYEKIFAADIFLRADVKNRKLIYPAQIGTRTYDDSRRENLVVFECVNRLLVKGYAPADIELEKAWTLGHTQKGGRADIVVSQNGEVLFIIECKTAGKEFERELRNMKSDGGQLFSYWQQEISCKWLILYAADFDGENFTYQIKTVNCSDYQNLIDLEDKQPETKLFKNARTVTERFAVWDETYEKNLEEDLIFSADSGAYDIGVKPKTKGSLIDFSKLEKVVNEFEEILRHNNVSDKENAFNRLIALFICKLVDESGKGDDDTVEFFYNAAADTYETLQDRLQRLHHDGMKNFMNEDIFYLADDYAKDLIAQYIGGNRDEFIKELRKSFRQLKFYTNNDFAFKEVHNEELFYQNGKVLVEVVKLFQNYKIINSQDLQTLGDLFEQLLNKGFKQNEGQFFTPIPITRFIWDSLPLDDFIDETPPKIIDYACGAGHFLTQGFAAVNACFARKNLQPPANWEDGKLFGVEKDYRLARVSKISLFMNGVNKGKIKFGDGLENYPDENIKAGTFDILVANPPYAVKNFKKFIRLKNEFATFEKISEDGSEIETLFVERIAQLVKAGGIAAVILPSSILNKDGKSFIAARESLLQNFNIRAIAQFGSKTFSATGTNTIVVFLQRLSRSPSRFNLLKDSVNNILHGTIPADWEESIIFDEYLKKIKVAADTYKKFVSREIDYADWRSDFYFGAYVAAFDAKFALRDNYKFYAFAIEIEREKIHYFAMTYKQTTLIIAAPQDNAEQEKFLGYSWSNAKGDEGIKVKTPGGLLYDDKNRVADNRLAAAVRNSFSGKKVDIPEAEKYYSYLKLCDMLDFDNADFTKTIKLTDSKIKPVEYTGEYPLVKIGKVAPYVTARTTLDKISVNDYVTTDNMLKDKQGVKIYDGLPKISSVTEYLSGDILISNIRPYLKKIWLADHSGGCSNDVLVFRSFNVNDLLSEYLFIVLSQDYFFDFMMATSKGLKMPRGDKYEIKNFEFPLPPIEIQRQIVSEFKAIDDEMLAQDAIIQKCNDDVRDKFVEMFVGKNFKTEPIDKLYDLQIGKTPSRDNFEYWNNGVYKWISIADMGNYDKFTEDTAEKISQLAVDETGIKIVPARTVIMSFKLTIGRIAVTSEEIYTNEAIVAFLDKNIEFIDADYLRFWLNLYNWSFGTMNAVKGLTLNKKSIGKTKIPIPPMNLQKEFAAFAQECDLAKDAARRRLAELQEARAALVEKYFR